jgi:hypothetical protein
MAAQPTSSTASQRPNKLPKSLLTPQQESAITRLYETDSTLLIAGVGFGKAVVGLTAACELIGAGELSRVLVLAPLRVCQLTWATERDIWEHIDPNLVAVACGSIKQRTAAVESPAKVVVTNFENAVWMVTQYGHLFDGLLIDEITKLKTVSGTGAKALRFWVKGLSWRVGMSANPVAEAGTDIYGQALLLDCGAALGTRKETFLRRYFYPTDFQNRNWVPLPGSEQAIADAMGDLIYYADDGGYKASLPPVDDLVEWLDMPGGGWDLYDALQALGKVTVGGRDVLAPSAGVLTQKLYQIAAGGLYGGADEERELVWFDPYKIDWAMGLAARSDGPVVIVYQYGFQLDALLARDPCALVLGRGSKFTETDLANWSAGRHKHLFMHPNSAAHGLNLQYGSSTLVCLSPVWGADPWQQVLGRLRRRGQAAERVTRWTGIARWTVDEKAWAGLDVKAELEARQMKYFKK